MKANNELVSWCRCDEALITWPPQMDCPWCGCGWLFTFLTCRKAFTFARGVLIEQSLEEIAYQDLLKWGSEPNWDEVEQWMDGMRELLSVVEEDREYVCLDGSFIPSDAKSIRFQGWYAAHDLPFVPQVRARLDPRVEAEILGNPKYWFKYANERESGQD